MNSPIVKMYNVILNLKTGLIRAEEQRLFEKRDIIWNGWDVARAVGGFWPSIMCDSITEGEITVVAYRCRARCAREPVKPGISGFITGLIHKFFIESTLKH